MYGNRSTLAFTCEIYANTSAWQHEPGPYENSWWEKGVFQFFNPNPNDIETVIQKWLPIFTYIINESTTEAHDIAITKVTPKKTVVGQGFPTNMNVTLVNQGDFTNNFNVTVYANTTIIDTLLNITLTSRNSTSLTFIWDSVGSAYGSYIINVTATPILGETDTSDNNMTYGIIKLTIPGDFSGDFYVDPADFALLAVAFGSTPWEPGMISEWNPNCDVDGNNKVDPFDYAMLCVRYGEHHP